MLFEYQLRRTARLLWLGTTTFRDHGSAAAARVLRGDIDGMFVNGKYRVPTGPKRGVHELFKNVSLL